MRRRSGSAYNSLLGSGSGTRNRPIAPSESGPCCQDSPIALPSDRPDSRDHKRRDRQAMKVAPRRQSRLFQIRTIGVLAAIRAPDGGARSLVVERPADLLAE